MELIDIISANPKVRQLSKKLVHALRNHMKEESVLIRSQLIQEISQIVIEEQPSIRTKHINGLCVDYDWKTLLKADPNIFIWMSVVICMFAFCFGWLMCKYKHKQLLNPINSL